MCPFYLPYLGAWTNFRTIKKLFTDPGWITRRQWNDRLVWLSKIGVFREMIYLWMQFSILASHAFLAVDLVMVIKNPFYPKNWRVIKIYAPVSIFGGAFYGIAMAKYY